MVLLCLLMPMLLHDIHTCPEETGRFVVSLAQCLVVVQMRSNAYCLPGCMQAGAALVLYLLLPMLLRDADSIPRGGAGDEAPAHHQVGHCPAGAGRVRLLCLWHEPN